MTRASLFLGLMAAAFTAGFLAMLPAPELGRFVRGLLT